MLRKHSGTDMSFNRETNNKPHDPSQEFDAGRRRAPEELQNFGSPVGMAAAVPLLRCLLLCVASAALLMPGNARAADLDPVLRGKWTSVPGSGYARNVTVQNHLVFSALGTDPANPQQVGSYATIGPVSGVSISGNNVYLADEFDGLHIA
jgi:hypothetical protein